MQYFLLVSAMKYSKNVIIPVSVFSSRLDVDYIINLVAMHRQNFVVRFLFIFTRCIDGMSTSNRNHCKQHTP